jgi:hypothetical protein
MAFLRLSVTSGDLVTVTLKQSIHPSARTPVSRRFRLLVLSVAVVLLALPGYVLPISVSAAAPACSLLTDRSEVGFVAPTWTPPATFVFDPDAPIHPRPSTVDGGNGYLTTVDQIEPGEEYTFALVQIFSCTTTTPDIADFSDGRWQVWAYYDYSTWDPYGFQHVVVDAETVFGDVFERYGSGDALTIEAPTVLPTQVAPLVGIDDAYYFVSVLTWDVEIRDDVITTDPAGDPLWGLEIVRGANYYFAPFTGPDGNILDLMFHVATIVASDDDDDTDDGTDDSTQNDADGETTETPTATDSGTAAPNPNPPATTWLPAAGGPPRVAAGRGNWQQSDGTLVSLRASAPAENQVRYETDGMQLTLTGAAGTSVETGLVADQNGEIICEVCAQLADGETIQAWMFSTPRLIGEHRVEDLPCQQFVLSLAAPHDGAGLVTVGAHTLQLTLPTTDGMQAVNVGVTVGGPVPTGIAAGEGLPSPWSAVLLASTIALAGAVATRRRPLPVQ